jgi:hypothetical protein
MEKDIA